MRGRLLVLLAALVVVGGLASLAIGSRPLSLATVLRRPRPTTTGRRPRPSCTRCGSPAHRAGHRGRGRPGRRRGADAGPHPQPAGRPRAARRRGRRLLRRGDRDLRVRRRGPGRLRLVRPGRRRPRRGLAVFAIGSSPRRSRPGLAGARRRRRQRAARAPSPRPIVVRDSDTLDSYRFWVVGSAVRPRARRCSGRCCPSCSLGMLLAAASTPGLNLLQLGDDVAASLGMSPAAPEGDGRRPP